MVSSTVKVLRKLWDSRPAQNLGEAANVKIVLAALSSGLQQNCSYAVDIICSMDGPQFKNAFLGARRTPTLACLACSVKTLAWDSSQSSLLLAKKLSLELDKTDLVASGLHSQLWPLHLNAPASTAALAKRIVGGSKDSEAARCRSSYSTCVPDMQHVFLRSNTELLCSLPLMPPPFDTATSNTVDGVSTSSKKRTKPKHSLEK